MPAKPSWQATVIALAFIALVGAVFLVVYVHTGISDAIEAWGAIGTIVGIVIGAIPTYFFGASATRAKQETQAVQGQLQAEQARRTQLEDKVAVLSGAADPAAVAAAAAIRPDLF